MITWIYDSLKTMHHEGDMLNGEDITGYCLAADLAEPPVGLPNAAKLYIMDWGELDAETQGSIGSRILMFDGDNRLWRPQ